MDDLFFVQEPHPYNSKAGNLLNIPKEAAKTPNGCEMGVLVSHAPPYKPSYKMTDQEEPLFKYSNIHASSCQNVTAQ